MEHVKRTLMPLLLIALVACSWLNPFDSVATERVDAGLKRALVSFATARTLNAVISVVQGTDLAIQPAGVGVKFAIGEVLDPINDIIERFSNLMLAATVSFGIQHILIKIGGHWIISVVLTAAALLWCGLYLRRIAIPDWATKLVVITMVLRFAIPAVTMGTDVLFHTFLAKEYTASQNLIESGANAAKSTLPQGTLPESTSVWEKMKNMASPDINIGNKIAGLVHTAERWPEQIIRLMVVFLLETLIIPVTLLWLLLAFVRSYLGVQSPLLKRLTNLTTSAGVRSS